MTSKKKKKKHILVISQYFYPEQFRINDICTEWVKRGYKVTVVTGIPNYPQGKFFDGYGLRKKRREKWHGINIIRIPLIARGHNAAGMIANYMSFVVSGIFWNLTTKIKADYAFTFEVSPMTQALLGVWYSKRHKIPNYLYVQDLWPENVEIVTGIHNRFIIGSIDKMVKYIYRNCNKIYGTSPSFVKEIQKKCDIRSKVDYWPQYAEEFYTPIDRITAIREIPEIPQNDKFKVIFTGNIGQAQGLDILPKTAELLKGKSIQFVIVGDGRERENFMAAIKEKHVEDMFLMIDRQPAERIPAMLSCCDAAFVSFMNNELFAKTIPAKLQSYMACGMPIIASAIGETERVVNEAKCGLASPIGDAAALAENIEQLSQMSKEKLEFMREASIKYSKENYSKQKLMDEIDRLFQ